MQHVFLAQEPVHRSPPKDLSSAMRYGNLLYVLNADAMPSTNPGACREHARKVLRNFNPDDDFLCFAGGDPLALTICTLALQDLGHDRVSFLRWERERDNDGRRTGLGFYMPTSLDLSLQVAA